ncbi:hypothetical protein C2U51_08540 [Enterobacteriaceae bacterium ENNIH1]|nr:hypothetical protein C2U51_08540 [Enterobacteriaceae bacterium ENNIH1]
MGSCAAPSAKGDDKFITTDYLQQCPRKSNPEGCGLGLSVVRAIMLAHGGSATYYQTQEKHSIFKISWPVSQEKQ